ncbi:RNA ligase family protein [Conchiformibius steedae]|uniref:RNA ligase family protein n=1 Tax=Conchiformibius steedae TaxID=153493 RepID=UPI00055994EF|nr:RNA ligase family protein [Conchiformibius steedae]
MSAAKYPRSLHAPISLGTTSDDRFMPAGYLRHFAQLPQLLITEKLDGQNNCFNRHGLFARSHAAPSQHPWDKPLLARWQQIRHDLGDIELFGESLYGIHSIAYSRLESFFYLFGVRQNGRWLDWDEVKFYAALFDFPTVPEIPVRFPLSESCARFADDNQALAHWLQGNLGMAWQDYTQTAGALGGYDPKSGLPCCEGLVIRNRAAFFANNGDLPVQPNEFDNIFKLVRAKHVQTDVHWSKTWQPAQLIDYQKYGWQAQQFERK